MNLRFAAYREGIALWGAAALIVSSGCFLPRYTVPLEKAARPARPTAILPLQPGDIRVSVDGAHASEREVIIHEFTKDQFTAAQDANAVFKSLAGGRANLLIGPDETAARLGSAGLEELTVYLNDPGGLDEPWKRTGLTRLAAKLAGGSCLRVRLLIVYESRPLYPRTPDWGANVTVQLEELDLAQARVLAHGMGESHFWGSVGAIGGPGAAVPYAVGKTFGRAVDQAARQAFAELSRATSTEHNPR